MSVKLKVRLAVIASDPYLTVRIPQNLMDALICEATAQNRSVEKEILNRIMATMDHDIEYRVRVISIKANQKEHLEELHSQQVSAEVLRMLKASAEKDALTLDQEVSFRLLVSLINAEQMGTSGQFAKLVVDPAMQAQIDQEKTFANYSRRYALELQQLELMVRYGDCWRGDEGIFEFNLIDVEEQKAFIHEKMKEERRAQ